MTTEQQQSAGGLSDGGAGHDDADDELPDEDDGTEAALPSGMPLLRDEGASPDDTGAGVEYDDDELPCALCRKIKKGIAYCASKGHPRPPKASKPAMPGDEGGDTQQEVVAHDAAIVQEKAEPPSGEAPMGDAHAEPQVDAPKLEGNGGEPASAEP
jgi:hypothetical protein